MKTSSIATGDQFLRDINRMVRQEKLICDTQISNELNREILHELERFRTKYEENLNKVKSSKNDLSLSDIYTLMKNVAEIPTIAIQLDAIKKYQQLFIENNQYIVD